MRPAREGKSGGTENDQGQWRDPKRRLWWLGLGIPAVPLISWALVAATGWGILWYLGPILMFGPLPALDALRGQDSTNPPQGTIEQLGQDPYYRLITYAFVPVQYLVFIWGAWIWTYGGLTPFEKVGLALTVGINAGVGINAAHELGHKRPRHERWLAKASLAQSFYGHFYTEHNRGHHVRVATPEDPASARIGQSLYRFLPRTVFGSLASAWRLEKPRFKRRKKSHWSIRNNVLNAWLMTIALWGGLLLVFGWGLAPYLLIQATVGILLLEIVNYVEHYGLLRQRGPSGRREPVRAEHSWNSNNFVTNILLYNLQRHSDHHANPTLSYQALQNHEAAPILPTGYPGMILLSLIPPLWRSVMDPRVARHYGGDITCANVQPSKLGSLVARYPAS